MTTKLAYYDDLSRMESSANVVEVRDVDGSPTAIVLDETIFYPHGGGQPADRGEIVSAGGRFFVSDVRNIDGVVLHAGQLMEGRLAPGERVSLKVERDRRLINTKNHSAGHIVMAATNRAFPQLYAIKGYHYPDGPYVEFSGIIPEDVKATAQQRIEAECRKIIEGGHRIICRLVEPGELERVCPQIPAGIPKDKPLRVSEIEGVTTIPCGGTHVAKTSEVGVIRIPKVKSKSGNTRVSYEVS